MSADPQPTEPAKPSRTHKPRRFASPRGGDADPKGTHVAQYYNPSPGVVAKRQRIKRVAARLFAERGLAAVGLTQVSHAMNLPSGSVKYYFRNRDDMLADILADHEVALSQRVGAAYDQHHRQFLDEHRPATPTETQLVHELADTSWRLNHIPILEADVLSRAQSPAPVPSPRLSTDTEQREELDF